MSLQTITSYLEENMQGKYKINEPVSKHTSFRIGGPADVLILPTNTEELADIMEVIRKEAVDITIMGNGSNLLVRDKGIRGVVVKIGNNLKNIICDGENIVAEAGVSLGAVSNQAAIRGLTGLEFAVGIPGSLGGAVYMNAGAYDGQMQDVVTAVTVLTKKGEFKRIPSTELSFAYRSSALQNTDDIITSVDMHLVKGQPSAISVKMADFTNRRTTKQPLDFPSAGSMFKRPPGYFAAALVEEAGLKGYKVGGAQVSEKHSGFVINRGNATAKDVLQLIKDVQDKVYAKSGQKLIPEVKIIGKE